jgi:hypothetical protein
MAVNVNLWDIFKRPNQSHGEPHPAQIEVLKSGARFKVVDCGRRWGKTAFALVTIMQAALSTPNGLYWYVAPTYRQGRTIVWRMLMAMIRLFPKYFQDKCKIEKNSLIVELPNNAVIEVKGAQEPDSLVGSGLDGVVFDEYGLEVYGVAPVWEQAVRPALADKLGWAIFISTPRGFNHFYELYDKAKGKQEEGWEAWKMPTHTNPHISRKELEVMRREMGDDLFEQDCMAEFKKRSGLVYKEFDRDIHVIDPMNPSEIPHQWSLEIGVDFGSAHPTAGIFVMFDHIHDIAYVVDEHYQSEWTIERNAGAMKAIEDKWLQPMRRRQPTVRWGDSQGRQEILEYNKLGYYLTPTYKGPESVPVGIGEVRKRLANNLITGKPKLYIGRNCVNTIREFENYAWTGTDNQQVESDDLMRMATKSKDAPKKVFDDAMDALRYVIQYHIEPGGETMVRRRNPVRNPITGI